MVLDTIIHYLILGKYVAIFIGSFLEGPTVMAAAGFFIKLGHLEILPSYFLLLLGDLSADVMWYYIGHIAAEKTIIKIEKHVGLTPGKSEKIKRLFNRHDSKILFISKLTMGFGFSLGTLMTAGMAKVPLKKFILVNFLGGLIWTAGLVSLGYFFGNIYLKISAGLKDVFLAFLAIFALFFLYAINKIIRKKFIEKI